MGGGRGAGRELRGSRVEVFKGWEMLGLLGGEGLMGGGGHWMGGESRGAGESPEGKYTAAPAVGGQEGDRGQPPPPVGGGSGWGVVSRVWGLVLDGAGLLFLCHRKESRWCEQNGGRAMISGRRMG